MPARLAYGSQNPSDSARIVSSSRIETAQNIVLELEFANGIGLTETQLNAVENLFGTALTPELRTFLRIHAGSKPNYDGRICCFDIRHSNGWKQGNFIERILSFDSILVQLDCRHYLREFVVHFGLTADYVEPAYLFPFAETPNGAVLMCVSGLHAGKIFTADNGDFGILFHSESLDDFWTSTYPPQNI